MYRSLDKTMSTLEMELTAARTIQRNDNHTDHEVATLTNIKEKEDEERTEKIADVFVVIGINTGFSSKRRRETVRETWMAVGDDLKRLENEKGIVMRFVIGRSSTAGGMVEREIESEAAKHGDFLFLKDHVEGYHRLSSKTRTYFSTAFAKWPNARFFVKVDDDVHLNPATLVSTLAVHRFKPRLYIGCMKSGPVLSNK